MNARMGYSLSMMMLFGTTAAGANFGIKPDTDIILSIFGASYFASRFLDYWNDKNAEKVKLDLLRVYRQKGPAVIKTEVKHEHEANS